MSLEPRKYSERLGVIDADQLQAACDIFDLGTVTDAETPVGGLFGQNVILTTKEGRFVLRGNPFGHVQLTKERVVARFIHERSSLPAAWPYYVSDDTEIFGWTFALMPCLAGQSGTVLWDVHGDDHVPLATATGEALARLHEASSAFFGPYDAQVDDFIAMDDFRDWVLHRFENWRTACHASNALSAEAERWIDDILDECAPALDVPFEPVLVHHDFRHGNLMFEDRGSAFEASGVFDLFEAYLADGEEDIVRMLWSVTNRAERSSFANAYVSARPLRDGASERLAIYAVADWLCIWEYGARHGGFERTTFLDWAVPIVRRARAVAS